MKRRETLLLLLLAGGAPAWPQQRSLFDRAMQEYRARNYAQAVLMLKRAAEADPGRADIHYYAGMAHNALKQNTEAERSFMLFLEKDPAGAPDLSRQAIGILASYWRAGKEWRKMADAMEALLTRIPDADAARPLRTFAAQTASEAYRTLGDTPYWKNDYAAALPHYRSALRHRPDDPLASERLGRCLLQTGGKDEARPLLTAALVHAPASSWQAKFNVATALARTFSRPADPDEAVAAVKGDEQSVLILRILSALDGKRYSEAFPDILEMEKKTSAGGDFASRVAQELSSLNRLSQEYCSFFVKEYPAHRSVGWLLDTLLRTYQTAEGDRDEARKKVVALLEGIVAQSPGTAAAQSAAMRLVEARFTGVPENEEILEEKVRMLRKFRADYPDSPQVNESLRREGEILADRLEDQERAIAVYTELVGTRKEPAYTANLAACHMKLERYETAAALYKTHLEAREKDHAARLQYGRCLLETGAIEEGMEQIRRVSTEAPDAGTRDRAAAALREYRRVPEDLAPRAETGVAALVVETSVRRTTYTTAASLLPGKPLIRRDEREISLYPFAPGRTDLPFALTVSADTRPVAAEPPALVAPSGGGFSCSWEDAVPATASPWKKRFAFSILFPLRDTLDEGVEVRREYARTGDGPATATIRAVLPGGGWTIEIACSGRGGKIESVSPEAPEKPSPLISVWRDVSTAAGPWSATVTLSPQGSLVSYLPRVRITRTERNPAAGAGPLSGRIGSDARWSLRPGTPAVLAGSAAETETVYELDEAVEYRQ